MPYVIVTTDDGREVGRFEVSTEAAQGDLSPGPGYNAVWLNGFGQHAAPGGIIGRALADASCIERGLDPERLSEKAMRLSRR